MFRLVVPKYSQSVIQERLFPEHRLFPVHLQVFSLQKPHTNPAIAKEF